MSSFEEYYKKNIGKQIRKYRQLNNLTQEGLSELVGKNDKYIGHIERGERNISTKGLIKIFEILKIQPREFFDFEECYRY